MDADKRRLREENFMKLRLFLAILLFCSFILACGYNGKIKQGNEVVAKVEKFRNEKGTLPNSLSEIGIEETESGPIYYKKESESKYIVWFGKKLGESETYDSDSKQWK